jgi:hypothetical protein
LSRNRVAIKIAAITNLLATVIVACGLMLWGALNVGTNVLEYQRSDDASASWDLAFWIIVITSIVPFFVGFWMLIRTTSIKQPSK